MDIIIISQYLRDITNFEDNNSRFVYLANMLVNNPDNEVEIVTSDFEHSKKKHFERIGDLPNVKISMFHEAGYPKNISLRRFASHKELARNIKKYLEHRKKPDVCYCAIPSLDVGYVVAQYCKSYGIRFIVDIQDLWPEAFKMVFNIPVISNILFAPMKRKADNIYSCADEIVAVSKTYAERAMAVNSKCKEATVVYLGTEKESFDKYVQHIEEKRDFLTIAYVGSMSASYDLVSVIDAISQINAREKIKFLAMGDGTLREKFIEYAKEKNVIAEFPGRLPYPQMIQQLNLCDIAVNPIRKGSAGSIINKVGDYAMAGLPVVNTQECKEYRELLDEYEAGINCECENVNQIANALRQLIEDIDLRKIMSINSRKLGLDRFDRKNAYNMIVDELIKCGGGQIN